MQTDERILKVLAAKTGGRHSPLFQWMTENHATLAAEFAVNGPQWKTRVPAMGEVGLLDAAGQKPSLRTAMQTWYRVCRALGATTPIKAMPAPIEKTPPHQTRPALPSVMDTPDDEVILTAGDGTVLNPKGKS